MIGPVPALAIAAFVERHDAVSSADLLLHFGIGESTLRRRRPALRRLGVEFVENGRWSFYARADLLARLPATRLPLTDRDAPIRTRPHTQRARTREELATKPHHAPPNEAPRSRHDRGTTEAPSSAHSVLTPSPQRPTSTEVHSIPLKKEERPMENVIQITSCIRVEPGALLKIPIRDAVAEKDGMGAVRTSFLDGETALDLNDVSGLELTSEKLTVSYRSDEIEPNTFELVEGTSIEVAGQAVPVGNLVGLVLEPATDSSTS
jgi:hypothetical protein